MTQNLTLIALSGVVLSAYTRAVKPNKKWHNRSTFIAFGGIGVADILASLGHPAMLVLACLAPLIALINAGEHVEPALQEKSVATLYIAWVGAFTISALIGHPLA